MKKLSPPMKFLISFMGVVCVFWGIVFTFQYIVDPFGTWGSSLKVGFNHYKTAQNRTERIFKPHQYRAMKPDVVFFGSSRVNYIMPATWPNVPDDKVFNYGINAAHIPEEAGFFHSALKTHTPKIAAIGIDMLQFSPYLNHFQNGYSESRNNLVAWSFITSFFQNLLDTVLSVDAIKLSFETIEDNKKRNSAKHYYLRGWNTRSDIKRYRLAEYKRVLWKFMQGTYRKYKFSRSNYRLFKDMIKTAKDKGVEPILYINPIHADFLGVIYQNRKWSEFEDFKRKMVALGPVWDFNYVNSITVNRKNFVDPSHFLPKIGTRMQEIMARVRTDPDFGVLLTKENINAELKKQRAAMNQWRQAHPEMMKVIENGVQKRSKRYFKENASRAILRDL